MTSCGSPRRRSACPTALASPDPVGTSPPVRLPPAGRVFEPPVADNARPVPYSDVTVPARSSPCGRRTRTSTSREASAAAEPDAWPESCPLENGGISGRIVDRRRNGVRVGALLGGLGARRNFLLRIHHEAQQQPESDDEQQPDDQSNRFFFHHVRDLRQAGILTRPIRSRGASLSGSAGSRRFLQPWHIAASLSAPRPGLQTTRREKHCFTGLSSSE